MFTCVRLTSPPNNNNQIDTVQRPTLQHECLSHCLRSLRRLRDRFSAFANRGGLGESSSADAARRATERADHALARLTEQARCRRLLPLGDLVATCLGRISSALPRRPGGALAAPAQHRSVQALISDANHTIESARMLLAAAHSVDDEQLAQEAGEVIQAAMHIRSALRTTLPRRAAEAA